MGLEMTLLDDSIMIRMGLRRDSKKNITKKMPNSGPSQVQKGPDKCSSINPFVGPTYGGPMEDP